MKKPDEIKKTLEHCIKTGMKCYMCSYHIRCLKVVRGKPIMQDALALIQQLEQELAAVKRERDALLEYLTTSVSLHCDICKYESDDGAICCQRLRDLKEKCFEWRGVCPENGEVQDGNQADNA